MDDRQFLLLLRFLLLLHHLLEWRDDQCERCAQLMAGIGEEAHLHLVEMLVVMSLLTDSHEMELGLLTTHHDASHPIEHSCEQQCIEQIHPYSPIEWWCDFDDQFVHMFKNLSSVAHQAHLQGVGARREVCELQLAVSRRREHPFVRQSLHPVVETEAVRHFHYI